MDKDDGGGDMDTGRKEVSFLEFGDTQIQRDFSRGVVRGVWVCAYIAYVQEWEAKEISSSQNLNLTLAGGLRKHARMMHLATCDAPKPQATTTGHESPKNAQNAKWQLAPEEEREE
jgi:hypothetical protein